MPNVLVLEDQPGWGALITSAVRHGKLPGCAIHAAETYRQAVDLIRENRFELAVLDYSLGPPGPEGPKTGLDVARELRSASPDCTILLVTLVDPERLWAACEELGVTLIEKGRADLEDEILREVRRGIVRSAGGSGPCGESSGCR